MFAAGSRIHDGRYTRGVRRRSKPGKDRPARDLRHARCFRPGGAAFETLEDRLLLSTSDLTQEIDNLLTSGNVSVPVNLGDVSLGSFLTAKNVTASFQDISQQGANWSGTVTLSADTASVILGSEFDGEIKGNAQNAHGLIGSYALNNQPLGDGAYSLGVTELDVTVPNVLTGTATGVTLGYAPGAPAGQQIAQVASLSATLTALDNATATLNNLDVFDNGFKLADASITADSLSIGSMLAITSPTVSFSGVDYTVGSPFEGTIGLSSKSVTLFPNKPTTASVWDFSGTYDVANEALSLKAGSTTIDFGSDVTVTADGLNFNLSNGGQSVSVSVDSATADIPKLDVSGSLTGLAITNDGFSVASATFTDNTTVAIGSVLTFT